MEGFIIERGFRVNPKIEWNFNLGLYTAVINNVVIMGGASISIHMEMKDLYRLTVFDARGHVLAYTNAHDHDEWIIQVCKYPECRLYHLDISKEHVL